MVSCSLVPLFLRLVDGLFVLLFGFLFCSLVCLLARLFVFWLDCLFVCLSVGLRLFVCVSDCLFVLVCLVCLFFVCLFVFVALVFGVRCALCVL